MTPSQECWFRRNPKNDQSKPNAIYLRPLADLAGESVCEIEYKSDKWIVRRREIKDAPTALRDLCDRWMDELSLAKCVVKKPTKKALAEAIGICAETFNRRMAFIQTQNEKKTEVV